MRIKKFTQKYNGKRTSESETEINFRSIDIIAECEILSSFCTEENLKYKTEVKTSGNLYSIQEYYSWNIRHANYEMKKLNIY